MKFKTVVVALFATFAIAAPSLEGQLEARQCSCKKVGDDWICTGKKCYDKVKRDLVPRQCSCKPIGNGEWLCTGPKCARSILAEENNLTRRGCTCRKVDDEWICTGTNCAGKVKRDLEKRQCSCHKLPDGEWLCGGPKCPLDFPTEETDLE
ncbi:hypothetical protein FSARC_14629 [Fusarium sarcochroum]|uniref:Uncharacterized protein n=1 Tax=Fusarium sarcochroum TaxID=1208366 RepID=A0A8H4WP07_9HYPO|nr:hypothetical protein FSARC_14629 [Fusarium sarcochroum]